MLAPPTLAGSIQAKMVTKDGYKCAAIVHRSVHDTTVTMWLSVGMVIPCPDCGHILWAELRGVGASRLVVYFDDDEQSGTYAEHVACCPECGTRLGNMLGGASAREVDGVPWSR
jgi:hypothetical protein